MSFEIKYWRLETRKSPRFERNALCGKGLRSGFKIEVLEGAQVVAFSHVTTNSPDPLLGVQSMDIGCLKRACLTRLPRVS